MALMAETSLLPVAAVACADAYVTVGASVIIKDDPFVTIFSDDDTAEVVVEDAESCTAALDYLGELSSTWNVVALVPAGELGVVHGLLRGRFSNLKVQPWWEADGSVHFGRVEIP